MILWANDYDDLEINILKLLELNKSGNEINEKNKLKLFNEWKRYWDLDKKYLLENNNFL